MERRTSTTVVHYTHGRGVGPNDNCPNCGVGGPLLSMPCKPQKPLVPADSVARPRLTQPHHTFTFKE